MTVFDLRSRGVMETDTRFRALLVDICRLATPEHFNSMKLLIGPELGRRRTIECDQMQKLFELMMQKCILSPRDLSDHDHPINVVFKDSVSVRNLIADYLNNGANTRRDQAIENNNKATLRSDIRRDHECAIASLSIGDPEMPQQLKAGLAYTAQRLGADWKAVARHTECMPESKILDSQKAFKGNTERLSMLVLMDWYRAQRSASVQDLRKILRKLPRNDIADGLRANEHLAK